MRSALIVLAATAALAGMARAGEFVPFVIPTKPDGESLAALPAGEPIATDGPRVVVRDGRFVRKGKQLRVWGVNLCFAANFPTPRDARHMAARLAEAGINSVRLHHMDMFSFPRGIWDADDPMKLSAEALRRLDTLIAECASRGITINVNLHVSRTHTKHLGLPREGDMPSFDKVIDIFTPRLIEAQKAYARDLLGHVNTVRGVRYADDPAIAFVEITNEDSFFMWDGEHRLRTLAPYYEKILRAMWIDWLKARYGTQAKLAAAWNTEAEPLGENLAAGADALGKAPADENAPRWSLEAHHGAEASAKTLADVDNALAVEVARLGGADWHCQLSCTHLPFRKGQYYTVSFRARADKSRPITVYTGMAHEPWGGLGLRRAAKLSKDWQTFRMGFTATADDDNGRVAFVLGDETGRVEIADLAFATGGQIGLDKGESLADGKVALFADSEVPARAVDRLRFLMDTEKRYFDDMRRTIREEIGCKALVTGTIVFGPAGLYAQSDMDFIDAHSYWHHPRFPGRAWDLGNWYVENTPMTDQPDRATLISLACKRLAGKPYTVSEYNHSAPQDAQAECVPMTAAFAASQGWDGIWLFAYSHKDDHHPRMYRSFFDMDMNPSKLGFFAPAAVLFRDGGLAPVPGQKVADLASDDPLTTFARLAHEHGRSMPNVVKSALEIGWRDILTHRTCASMGAKPARPQRTGEPIAWTVTDGRGRFRARGRRALAETGWWPGEDGKPVFRAVMAAAMDGKPLAESGKVLLAACGRCENRNMQFSADRRTVGRNWGEPPVRIEAVTHTVGGLGEPGGKVTLQPLGPDGRPKGKALALRLGKAGSVKLEAGYGTMWYLLTR